MILSYGFSSMTLFRALPSLMLRHFLPLMLPLMIAAIFILRIPVAI